MIKSSKSVEIIVVDRPFVVVCQLTSLIASLVRYMDVVDLAIEVPL